MTAAAVYAICTLQAFAAEPTTTTPKAPPSIGAVLPKTAAQLAADISKNASKPSFKGDLANTNKHFHKDLRSEKYRVTRKPAPAPRSNRLNRVAPQPTRTAWTTPAIAPRPSVSPLGSLGKSVGGGGATAMYLNGAAHMVGSSLSDLIKEGMKPKCEHAMYKGELPPIADYKEPVVRQDLHAVCQMHADWAQYYMDDYNRLAAKGAGYYPTAEEIQVHQTAHTYMMNLAKSCSLAYVTYKGCMKKYPVWTDEENPHKLHGQNYQALWYPETLEQ